MQALYRWFDQDGQLLYVGISQTLWNRTKQHQQTADWFTEISFCTVEWYESRYEVENAENRAIMNENPIYNKTSQVRVSSSTLIVTPPDTRNFESVLNQMRKTIQQLNEKVAFQSKQLQRQQLDRDHDTRIRERMWKIIEQRTTPNAHNG